jgi:hypothetical protein
VHGDRGTVVIVAAASLVTTLALLATTPAMAGTRTSAGWATAANKACAAAYAKIRTLPSPTTRDRYIADLRGILTISEQLSRQLAEIPRPTRESRAISQLLSLLNAANNLVEHRLLPAFISGDQAATARASTESGRLGTRFNTLARSLGARVCAANPAPHG